ncbi:MAG: type VI secretion system ImpA family N-terminal domain-containing protein [Treponema sp.]|jgi:type VI secretion system ImpA family protein|nr:type VI secretion system ImpA family N-terminal domain-containing protein [Treponema sp.]
MISLEEMAVPLEGENPAGENLEYDSIYMEMDSLAVSLPDSQMGESKIEGRGPDWKKLKENCYKLWGKTRDLRVASYLAIAETAAGCLEDCVAAFKLILFLVQDMWDALYPKLDTDDDNDPTERLNILAMLSPEPGAINDPIMFISIFRTLRLVPALPYTLRDHLISINEFEAADGAPVNPCLITGELQRIPLEAVEKQAALAQELKETVEAVCSAANEKMQGGYSLAMSSLVAEINKLKKFYSNCLQSAGGGEFSNGEGGDGAQGGALSSADESIPHAGNVNMASFVPRTRSDALLLLRKGAEYFQRQEPNSPIPLLVNRALRFSEMSFIDLLEDIVPDALSQGKTILGIKDSV